MPVQYLWGVGDLIEALHCQVMTLNFNLYIIDFILMLMYYLKILLLVYVHTTSFSKCVICLQMWYAL